jgi:hypothetical protein
MEIQSVAIPSVIEGYSLQLDGVTKYELNGLKIRDNGEDYIIGNLALSEGKNPHKAINSSVNEIDYRLLIKTSLMIASKFVKEPMVVATGFPQATININKKQAVDYISGLDSVEYDARPYGGRGYKTETFGINKTDIITETAAATRALRNNPARKDENFFIVSVGYGTVEIGLSTVDGIVKRTEASASGLRYAINMAKDQMVENHYVGLRTEHQFDQAFQKGKIIINRQRVDLSEIRRNALQQHYKDVISPMIRNAWEDEDFSTADTIVLVGGGALYPDVVQCFEEEFDGFATVEVAEEPAYTASVGYCLHAKDIGSGNKASAVGIDVGNSQTVISFYKEEE